MIEIKDLKIYAEKLMFKMDDKELEALQQEFDTILKQMDLLSKIPGIEEANAMHFPFELEEVQLREDIDINLLTREEALSGTKFVQNGEVRVPKVVE